MELIYRRLAIVILIISLIFFTGCISNFPSILDPIIGTGADESETPPVIKNTSDDKISDTDNSNNESQTASSEEVKASNPDLNDPVSAQEDSTITDEAIEVSMKPANDSIPSLDEEDEPETFVSEDTRESDEDMESKQLSNQELIDTTLEYVQASNDFWEQGDMDNAIDALDKAYSLILKIKSTNDLELLQQKEDLRVTISKRIIQVYSSRFTAANGTYKAIPLVMNSHVEKALNQFKGRERSFFLASYARSGRYRPAIVKALKEAGLPEELSWLPLIESGFKIRALSRARALGMWQFIASTGYKYGLKRDTWIDERMDPQKSTEAAIAYLTELHHIFGDWSTALAAYNCGERRVLKQIKAQKVDYLDNFWDLYESLPRETAFYLPKFIAVLHIVNDPNAYGFNLPPLEDEIQFDEVTISKQILIKKVAEVIGVEYNLLKDLNPELRQDLTPKTPYSLKVPYGKGEVLLSRIQDIPVWSPPVPAYVIHRVRSGESLSVIAERYGTSVRAIMNMNGLKSRNFVRAGWRLKIPTKASYASVNRAATVKTSETGGKLSEYIVKKGDSLWEIANRYNTTVNAIRSLNRLQSSTLQIGQVLVISAGLTSSEPGNTQNYRVKKGDSPYLIAKRYRMNLSEFLSLNNLTARSMIFPGQIVQVVAN